MDVIWLYAVLIGLALGLIMKDSKRRLCSDLILGAVSTILGAYIFQSTDLISHGPLVGAASAAFIALGVKRVFLTNWWFSFAIIEDIEDN